MILNIIIMIYVFFNGKMFNVFKNEGRGVLNVLEFKKINKKLIDFNGYLSDI